MRKNLHLPRGVILLTDITVVMVAVGIAYLVRFNFTIPDRELEHMPRAMGIVMALRLISFILAGTHLGMVRFTGLRDITRIFLVNLAISILLSGLNVLTFYFVHGRFVVPFSIIIIEFLVTSTAMVFLRLLAKVTLLGTGQSSVTTGGAIIYGADQAGIFTLNALQRSNSQTQRVVAFVDDNPSKTGSRIEGIPIHSPSELADLFEQHKARLLIIATGKLPPEKKKPAIETALRVGARVLNVPPVSQWINGELSFNQIRDISIEDLLGRDVIETNSTVVDQQLEGKTILITGAAGSIGSEIARQILQKKTGQVIMLDMAETPLFYLEQECQEKFSDRKPVCILGDVRDSVSMRRLFEEFRPQLVFHAAAYKHVPLMDKNPLQAAGTNILGTRILADLAIAYGVEKFIMVSTDKAVNPTNVMGASKRAAEIYIQAMNNDTTRFITTRFGNVLGSNGSVVSIFRKQIEERKPIPVTHPDIVRYFMTIPEACRLVLEAAAMGNGGEIYVFDMGQPVRILDLAKKMIQLYGLELDRDIRILFTGLRPGEKLFEELLATAENTLPTHHPKIMIGKTRPMNTPEVSQHMENFRTHLENNDAASLVREMKKMIPEYISQNSEFEKLDAGQETA